MPYKTLKYTPFRKRTIMFVAVMAVFLIAAYLYSPMYADGPLVGDCFDGALSKDPMNCYILEQADEKDVIQIEAVYESAGALLYIYLIQTDPVSEQVGKFFKDRAEEFLNKWPDSVYYHPAIESCVQHYSASHEECFLNIVTDWKGDDILPYSNMYKNILVRSGGEEARYFERAWPSQTKIWPPSLRSDMVSTSTSPAKRFDVSDVDMINFPERPCASIDPDAFCDAPKDHHSRQGGIVGHLENIVYIHYKNPPDDEKELEEIKETLLSTCRRAAICTEWLDDDNNRWVPLASALSAEPGASMRFHGPLSNSTSTMVFDDDPARYTAEIVRLTRNALGLEPGESLNILTREGRGQGGREAQIKIIPVSYSYEDMERYEVILNRFVDSKSNTVGILGAQLSDNVMPAFQGVLYWNPEGPKESLILESRSAPHPETYRSMIVLFAVNGKIALDALPELLPALDIPIEAVGLVVEEYPGKFSIYSTDGHPCDGKGDYVSTDDIHDCYDPYRDRYFQPLIRTWATDLGVPETASYPIVLATGLILALYILASMLFTAYSIIAWLWRVVRRRAGGR